MSASVIIGPLVLNEFEIPSHIRIGGRQRLAIHQLLGGSRVIDALGPDEGDISWSGVFSGSDAAIRYRELEVIRRSGLAVPLIWNGFAYSVIISELDGEYKGPYWIFYKLVCSVVADAAAVLIGSSVSAAGQALADISSAGGLGIDTSTLTASLGPGGTVSAANASMVNGDLMSSISQANTNLASATVGLQSSDFTTALAAAQQTANMSFAIGYLSRAAVNVSQIQNGLG